MVPPTLRSPSPPIHPLEFTGAAVLYMVVAGLLAVSATPLGHLALVRPGAGLALALLLVGGPRLAAGVGVGAALAWLVAPTPAALALVEALSAAVAAALGAWLLRRQPGFDLRCGTFGACRQLLAYACGAAAGAGALTGTTTLLLLGQIDASAWLPQGMRWWMGQALGMLLITPLVLAVRAAWGGPGRHTRLAEGALVYALSFIAGQVIFSGWQSSLFSPVANAYWMFLFVTWAGVRLGMAGTVGLLCLIALQALWGTQGGTGFFARDIAATQGFGYGSYMMILSLVGMSLAAYLSELRWQRADLRIAAIAFECQEGLLITDTQGVVLRANQSFLRMSGHTAPEVLGKTSRVLCAHAENAPDPAPAHDDHHLPHQDVQRREWHRRKSGEAYPVWLTITPVTNRNARITHYVLAITDITDFQRQAQQQREKEQKHRDTLVREVHHRIKNNLQGIIGMLRGFGNAHPQLQAPITEVIGQVQSISVIHGLQGQACMDQVRLCELTSAVATSIGSLWQTPVCVDIPEPWLPCRIHQTEAVPVALVLHELILNAVKHGGQQHADVRITLRKGREPDVVQITICNPGHWPQEVMAGHAGLDLVAALMPRSGATLSMEQQNDRAVTRLEFQPPVIQAEQA